MTETLDSSSLSKVNFLSSGEIADPLRLGTRSERENDNVSDARACVCMCVYVTVTAKVNDDNSIFQRYPVIKQDASSLLKRLHWLLVSSRI